MAQVLAVFAELERKMIGQRTRDALAVKRAQGVRLGRPRTLPEDVRARIVAEHDAGAGCSTDPIRPSPRAKPTRPTKPLTGPTANSAGGDSPTRPVDLLVAQRRPHPGRDGCHDHGTEPERCG